MIISLDGRKPCYKPRQRRRHSPSVVRDRYRGRGQFRSRRAGNDVRGRQWSHEPPKRNTTPDNASTNSVAQQKKRFSVYNLPTGVVSIQLPQTTSTSTTSVVLPNTVRTSVTATDSTFTVDIDNVLDTESVETRTNQCPR